MHSQQTSTSFLPFNGQDFGGSNYPRLSAPVRITEQVWPAETLPAVSICCITYNHEAFIRDAIQGFLMQETTFPVEILVHDDASTDQTAEIIREYSKKYTHIFKSIFQTENQYSNGSHPFVINLKCAIGEFIAICEGDDYWTNEKKLEAQFQYMLENKDCVGCFHQSRLVDEKNQPIRDTLGQFNRKKYNSFEAFQELQSSYATNSLFFKNVFDYILPEWFIKRPNDMALEVLLTQYGNLGFIDRNMSDYRKHAGGVWSQLSVEMQYFELMHRLQLWIDDYSFPSQLKPIVKQKFLEVYEDQPLNHKLREIEERLYWASEEAERIKNSLSWKITRPLRTLHNMVLNLGKHKK